MLIFENLQHNSTPNLSMSPQALISQVICYENTLLIPGSLLSYINADLGPDPSYTWISVSWSLCAAVMVSVAGRLGDIFGRRYFMLCGSAIAFIGTISGLTSPINATEHNPLTSSFLSWCYRKEHSSNDCQRHLLWLRSRHSGDLLRMPDGAGALQ